MGTNQRYRRKLLRQACLLAAAAAILCVLVYYVNRTVHPATDLEIWFERPDGSRTPSFAVEIARTEGERSKGLMFRKEMADDRGMIFIYKDSGHRNFWMKNTYIALDMIFIDAERRVVGTVKDAQPMTTVLRGVDKSSQYIVELNAGTADQQRIVEGALLKSSAAIPAAVN